MNENCKNCSQPIVASFCEKCGQKKYKRIDRKYLSDEFQYTFLHLNKGFLFSIKNILKNPGKTARQFIEGNRVNHYKPILLVFVLSGISTFISFKILHLKKIMSESFAEQRINSAFMADFSEFLSNYNSLIMLALVPLFALTTKIAFRKWGHNYFEHVVMNAYIVATYTLLSIIFIFPVMYFFRDDAKIFLSITKYTTLMVPFLLVWFFKGFYPERTLKSIILKVLGVIGLTALGYLLILFLAVVIGLAYATFTKVDGIQYLKPK